MPIEMFSSFVALMLAISLASERLVSLVKTASNWLAESRPTHGQEKIRRLTIIAVAFASAWGTAGFLTTTEGWDLFGVVAVNDDQSLPAWAVGFLASGGSAFWNNVLGYTKAVKDLQKDKVPADRRGPN